MRLHATMRALTAVAATAAIAAPSAGAAIPRPSGVSGGSATPTAVQPHPSGSSDATPLVIAAIAGGLAVGGYGARRRMAGTASVRPGSMQSS